MSQVTTAKLPPNRGKKRTDFTSSQLIVAICIFLVAALVCFMLGVLVGRVEKSAGARSSMPMPDQPVVEPQSGMAAPAPEQLEESGTKPGEGRQAYPRPVVLPAIRPEDTAPPPVSAPLWPLLRTVEAVDEEPVPAPHPVDKEPAKETRVPKMPAASNVDEPVEAAASEPAAEQAPAKPEPPKDVVEVPAKPKPPKDMVEAPAETPPKPELVPVPLAQPKLPERTAGKGAFGVQVAAFLGADRQKTAEDYKRRLKANSGLEAMLIHSEDNTCVRVIIAGYPDSKTAAAACKELRKRAGFKDCFVKPLR